MSAIDIDPDWTCDHTHWLSRALNWDQHDQNRSYLLRGRTLQGAELWLTNQAPEKTPFPPASRSTTSAPVDSAESIDSEPSSWRHSSPWPLLSVWQPSHSCNETKPQPKSRVPTTKPTEPTKRPTEPTKKPTEPTKKPTELAWPRPRLEPGSWQHSRAELWNETGARCAARHGSG